MDGRIILEDEKLYDLCAFLYKRWTTGIYELKLNLYKLGVMDYKTEKTRALYLSSSKRYRSKKSFSTGGRIILVATICQS